MDEARRYTEDEIAAIFEEAAHAQEQAQRRLSRREGLTLAELQAIGQETGITPEFVARAATTLDVAGTPERPRTMFGMPTSVERRAELPGPLTDEEWDRLVVDLRDTFRATGKVRRDGSLREWRNGNLRAHVEPSQSGYRLRLSTRNGNAEETLRLGAMGLLMGAIFLVLLATKGSAESGMMVIMSLFVAAGVGGIGSTAYMLPRWAEKRGHQMEAVIARTLERAAPLPASVPTAEPPTSRLDLDALDEVTDSSPVQARGRVRT